MVPLSARRNAGARHGRFCFTGETGGSSMTANELKIFAAWAAEHWDERGDWEYWSADRREDLAKMGVNASDQELRVVFNFCRLGWKRDEIDINTLPAKLEVGGAAAGRGRGGGKVEAFGTVTAALQFGHVAVTPIWACVAEMC